jgi:hypothetical protein
MRTPLLNLEPSEMCSPERLTPISPNSKPLTFFSLPPPAPRPRTRTPPTPPRRRVAQPTIPPALSRQLDDLGNVLLMLEFRNTVLSPDMLDQRLDIATNRHLVRVPRAQHARVLSIRAVAMAFYDEAVRDLEAALVAVVVFADFPRLAGRQVQAVFAVWTVWDRRGHYAAGECLGAVALQV